MYSSDTTKYHIHLTIHAAGVVENTDVIGAIFGQTEGLLGEDLDLRDLQKSGRVGRIEVKIESKKGETDGEIIISSSLDRAETALLAAAIETIDRIGPCSASISVDRIEDIRVTKRRHITERAKELLIESFDDGITDSQIILDQVRDTIRAEKAEEIGSEKLPAGPNVRQSDAIIIVEGRADVVNLLKVGIKNAVAVEGTKIPETVKELCATKTATAFLDGDRGGDLILQELLQTTDIDYIASCPRGKSVEGMTRKEIIKALRSKVPADYVHTGKAVAEKKSTETETPKTQEKKETKASKEKKPAMSPEEQINSHISEVLGQKTARFVGRDNSILMESNINELENVLSALDDEVFGIIVDGELDQKAIDKIADKGAEYVAAKDFKNITKRPATLKLIKT
jgi:DNA primase